MNRKILLSVAVAAGITAGGVGTLAAKPSLSSPAGSAAASRPNVIVILADDMGYADGMGNTEIPVPNLQRLAKEGVTFETAYVTAPVCVPSRMGLMSGCHQQRFGIYGNFHGLEENKLFLAHTLMPKVLQDGGYRTALVGKWHLSGNDYKVFHYGHPLDRGFDESIAVTVGKEFWAGQKYWRGRKMMASPKYQTDFFGTMVKNQKKRF